MEANQCPLACYVHRVCPLTVARSGWKERNLSKIIHLKVFAALFPGEASWKWSFNFYPSSASASAVWKCGLPWMVGEVAYTLEAYRSLVCLQLFPTNRGWHLQVLAGSVYAALFDTASVIPFFFAGRLLWPSWNWDVHLLWHGTGWDPF